MCGIAGYFLKPGATAPAGLLGRFADLMTHRGPDGTASKNIGQAGLPIPDWRLLIWQAASNPLVSDQKMAMANGEIYNHQALRDQMAPADRPDSLSDCAVIFAAIQPPWQPIYRSAARNVCAGRL